MVLGGSFNDENGSTSYSQVLYHYRFAPEPCASHWENQLNLYHPADQLISMVVHSASNDTTDVTSPSSCVGGIHLAFSGSQRMREEYDNGTAPGVQSMSDFRGYIDNETGSVVPLSPSDMEDDYDALAKAIGSYNGAMKVFRNRSWARLIRYTTPGAPGVNDMGKNKCYSCKYTINVRDTEIALGGNLRKYVWQGGLGADINGDGDIVDVMDDPKTEEDEAVIEESTPWCFVFGEAEWVAGETFEQTYNTARGDALAEPSIPAVGRINCATGESLDD